MAFGLGGAAAIGPESEADAPDASRAFILAIACCTA
jgi:hypothetical protein